MYQVLLVDDEPIILSGIKFLIDWEKNDCVVVDTARNGQQALDKIRTLRPDIVICDITMPVLSGLELLRIVNEEQPLVAFVMLTNHQAFDLARESLRLRAVDYLLKSQLEAEALEKSLTVAKAEHDKRCQLAKAEMTDSYVKIDRAQLLRETFLRLMQGAPGVSSVADTVPILLENGFAPGFGLLYLPVEFAGGELPLTDADRNRLFAWQREVVEKLAQNCFPQFSLFAPDNQCECLVMVCWGMAEADCLEKLDGFCARLESASGNITGASVGVLATDLFAQVEQVDQCRSQLFALRDYYYYSGCTRTTFCQVPTVDYRSLALPGVAGRLEAELTAKNLTACTALLDRAITNVREIPHRRSQSVWLCGELYGSACAAAARMNPDTPEGRSFFDRESGYRDIDLLFTREQVVRWLLRLRNELTVLLDQMDTGRNELLEKARQYVLDNVYKRIMLQDVADFVCISPGYLSATFKRMYNQNLVDYINQAKMETACRLIEEGGRRIGEISYMLSFENAYYFTKVFKRHTGMTPTEYQHKVKK